MHEDLVKAYVDRLLREGFTIDVTGEDTIVIVDPVDARNFLGARDARREARPDLHRGAIISYLKQLHRIV